MALTPNTTSEASVARGQQSMVSLRQPVSKSTVERARTLEELEAQFTAIAANAQAIVDAAGAELCTKPPLQGSWSIAECLQHLNASADSYFPIWQQVIANAGPRREAFDAPYRTDFWGRLFSWILEPPARIKSKTLLGLEPTGCSDVAIVLDGFLERQQRIVSTLRRCRGRAIDHVKMASPVDPRIRYSIWSSFLINAAHERRHLWQAEQALQKLC